MIRVTAEFLLKDGVYEEALKTARELIEITRTENGCIQYNMVQSNENEKELMIFECWEDQSVLDIHSESEHFKRLVPKLAKLCEKTPVVKTYTQII